MFLLSRVRAGRAEGKGMVIGKGKGNIRRRDVSRVLYSIQDGTRRERESCTGLDLDSVQEGDCEWT